MSARDDHGRILMAAGALGAGALVAAAVMRARQKPGALVPPVIEVPVTPVEDLVREHGVLRRVLLVYDAAVERAERFTTAEPVQRAANLVRRFVEDYHAELEEQYVFPIFERAGVLLDLVGALREQHRIGRRLTDGVLRSGLIGGDMADLHSNMRAFTRMYRAHTAHEDTVLYPALRTLVGPRAYAELGELFEEQERARFGRRGFEDAVTEVARIEDTLGIGDLSTYTPR